MVPGLPRPDESCAVAPLASSKLHAPTRPPVGGGGWLRLSVTGMLFGDPVAPEAVTITVPV